MPHRQKALIPTNIQLDNVVSDLTDKTGLAILHRIVAGECDPENLATQRNRCLRASEQTVARSWQGNWREEHRFALAHDDCLGRPIAECDQMIRQALQRLPTFTDQISALVKPMRSPHRTRVRPTYLHQALNRVFGVDLTRVPTLGIDTVLVLAIEIGPDLSCFRFSTGPGRPYAKRPSMRDTARPSSGPLTARAWPAGTPRRRSKPPLTSQHVSSTPC